MRRVIFLLSIYILGLVLLLLGTEGRLSIPLIALIIVRKSIFNETKAQQIRYALSNLAS